MGVTFISPCSDSGHYLKDMGALENFLPEQVGGSQEAVQKILSRDGQEQRQGSRLEQRQQETVASTRGPADQQWGRGRKSFWCAQK